MAECKDIDKALANLQGKINEQNKRIRDVENLQKQCCDKKENGDKNKPTDLTEINRRLEKVEKDILTLGGVVKEVIDDLKDALDSLDEHNKNADESQGIFAKILDFFTDD